MFESLVTLNENQKPVPQLADNWTHEGADWVFTIRSGISFHDGAEMTAYDVVASYQAFIANANSNPYGSRLSLFIEDMQAIDDRQLKMYLQPKVRMSDPVSYTHLFWFALAIYTQM